MRGPLRPNDPRRIGRYRLESRLGQGGMGTVFLGRAPDGRPVAIKIIKPELAYEEQFRARFRSEVNRARQVPPFCTAELLDADADHETPYLVVEYVDGPSLADVVEDQGPLTGGNLYSVAVGVATALAAIHGAGVIHRDLKPRNVLFSLGTPKVIDFGIARAFEATSQHTGTDQMVGTVAYMAPERFDAGSARSAIGPAADVFAWGVVVAYAGTGRTPFTGDSAAATAARILTQPPDLTGLPAPLRDLVAMTLAKDPARRPTAARLIDMLVAAGASGNTPELREATQAVRQPAASNTTTVVTDRRRWGRLAPVLAAVALIGVVTAGVFAFTPVRQLVEADLPGAGPIPTPAAPDPGLLPSGPPSDPPATSAEPAPARSATGRPTGPDDDAPVVVPSRSKVATPPCRTGAISVTITAQDDNPAAAGTHKAIVSVVNESEASCRIKGRAFVSLYNPADEPIDVPTRTVNEPGAATDMILRPGGGSFQGIKWVACDRDTCPAAATFRAALEEGSRGVVAEMEGFPDASRPQIGMSSLQLGTLQPSTQGVVAW